MEQNQINTTSHQTQETNANLYQNNINEPPSKTELKGPSKLKSLKTRQTTVESEDEDEVYQQIKDSRFKQQRLPAWRPVPNIISILIVFSFFGLLFIILGIVLLVYSNKVKSAEIEYSDCALNTVCRKQILIEDDIDQPVFVYYQLNGFYQNSRRYLKSRDISQLTGDDPYSHDDCEPAETNEEMGFDENRTAMDGSTTLIKKETAIPCGLVAKTFFNDTFKFYINDKDLPVDESNIAFDRDKKIYNKEIDPSKQWISLKNEHFLVWMRPSGLPNPMKLWGKIEQDLKKDDIIRIEIDYKYDVKHYGGKKKIILSNTTIFGGNNTFMGICYIVVGILSLICVIIFLIGYKIQMKKEKEL